MANRPSLLACLWLAVTGASATRSSNMGKTMMVFGDAKKVVEDIVKAIE